jgi:hypothetical protein
VKKPDRNPKTVLDALCMVWQKYPDLRVGQIISNSVKSGSLEPRSLEDLFFLENLDLAAMIMDFHNMKIDDD